MEGIILTTKLELENYIQRSIDQAFINHLSKLKESSHQKDFYTRFEAAQELHCSVSTIDRMIRDGDLTKSKVRSKTVVPAYQVKAFKEKLLAA